MQKDDVARIAAGLTLGVQVTFAAHVPDAELWNRSGPYYVVGLFAEKRGINVTIAPEYPYDPARRGEGPTDGFYIGGGGFDDLLPITRNHLKENRDDQ